MRDYIIKNGAKQIFERFGHTGRPHRIRQRFWVRANEWLDRIIYTDVQETPATERFVLWRDVNSAVTTALPPREDLPRRLLRQGSIRLRVKELTQGTKFVKKSYIRKLEARVAAMIILTGKLEEGGYVSVPNLAAPTAKRQRVESLLITPPYPPQQLEPPKSTTITAVGVRRHYDLKMELRFSGTIRGRACLYTANSTDTTATLIVDAIRKRLISLGFDPADVDAAIDLTVDEGLIRV